MNGPEHYAEAERLLEHSKTVFPELTAGIVAKAQVHATLALVAATVAERITWGYGDGHATTVNGGWEERVQ